jgi:spore coat protein U-like protein
VTALKALAAASCVLLAVASRAEAACTLSSTSISFGTYDVFQAGPTDSTGTITYRCDKKDHGIRITISAGSGGTFTSRTLRSGVETMGYNLFLNAAFTQVWGDGTGGTTTYYVHNPPNKKDVQVPVYSRIPAGQDVGVGNYSDTVVVTLEY